MQDVSQEECLTRGWNYDRPWGSLLREKGNLRWEGLFFTFFFNQTSHVCMRLEWEGLQSDDSFKVVGETGGEVWAVGGGDGIVEWLRMVGMGWWLRM